MKKFSKILLLIMAVCLIACVFVACDLLDNNSYIIGEKGEKGDDGKGIVSIEKTSSVGLVDTYTITYTDETTTTFTVTNGTQSIQEDKGYKSGAFLSTADTLSENETISTKINNISKNKVYLFSATLTETFSGLTLSHGGSTFGATKLEITPTQIIVYRYTDQWFEGAPYNHGLTISNNIQFVVQTNSAGYLTMKLESNGSIYNISTASQLFNGSVNAADAVKVNSSMKDVTFSVTSRDINKKIWVMGDSYVNTNTQASWVYYLNSYGFTNWLMNSYPGETSNAGLTALKNLLEIAVPEAILWCYGMNDGKDAGTTPSSAFISGIETFLSLCEAYNIEPILATIPSCPNHSNEGKNAYIRNSGYRYVDFAKAVGAQSDGTWYPGMLRDDNVHPTIEGAKALAFQAMADCPELVQ